MVHYWPTVGIQKQNVSILFPLAVSIQRGLPSHRWRSMFQGKYFPNLATFFSLSPCLLVDSFLDFALFLGISFSQPNGERERKAIFFINFLCIYTFPTLRHSWARAFPPLFRKTKFSPQGPLVGACKIMCSLCNWSSLVSWGCHMISFDQNNILTKQYKSALH